jgi:hypothetical protein
MNLSYVVVAPPYNPDGGGAIFLHELAYALDDLGAKVKMWPVHNPAPGHPVAWVKAAFQHPSLLWRGPWFAFAPGRKLPLAKPDDLRKSVVIYPEIVLGNPLKAQKVVRWLMYRPGLLYPYEFGPDEMFFRVGEMFDLPEVTGGAPDLFLWKVNPIYRNEGRKDRSGACFMVRKGLEKPRIAETADAIQIDDLSHQEIASIFNRCETFYSYDEATFYSQYAAICGCLSVVIPGLYPSREAWVSEHELARYGVAYGLDDLDHARATQDRVLPLLQAKEAAGLDTVRNFVALTEARFGGGEGRTDIAAKT